MTDLIPVESLVAYHTQPQAWYESTSQPASQPEEVSGTVAIGQILAFLSASGLMPNEGQVFADIATALPLLGKFEHALVLLDVSSREVQATSSEADDSPAEPSLRLGQLKGAVIFRTNGDHRAVLDQLNRVVGRYTNAEIARLDQQSYSGVKSQRLVDNRLPGWAIWEWGPLDDFFVLCFGSGTFEAISRTYQGKAPSLTGDPWYQAAKEKTRTRTFLLECYLNLAAFEHQLGDAAAERYRNVMKAMDAEGMTKDLWTIGMQGNALAWYRCYARAGEDTIRRYSDPQAYSPKNTRIIPPEAAHRAVIRVPTQWLVKNLPNAWIEARSDREAWVRIWQRLEDETGVSLDENLINHIKSDVVLFDYPPHPLRIPLALTVAFEIDDREAVQASVNSILRAWSRYLEDRATRSKSSLVRVKVIHDKDGVWYLQAGILGPALKVTDRYIVISWSPQALRQALTYIESASDTEPTGRR